MNKVDLIAKVAEGSQLTKKSAELAVNATFGAIEDALSTGEKVQIIGFGTFETRTRAARTGRNPQTGEEVQIPEAVVPAFKPGNALKDKVR